MTLRPYTSEPANSYNDSIKGAYSAEMSIIEPNSVTTESILPTVIIGIDNHMDCNNQRCIYALLQ